MCMYMCMCMYICMYMCMCMCMYICMYMCKCMYMCMCICMYMCICMCMYTYMCMCNMCMCLQTCAYMCFLCICVYTKQWNLQIKDTLDRHFVLCKEVALNLEVQIYWNYGSKYFGTSSCVLCREIVLISEHPLSEISLYMQGQVCVVPSASALQSCV